ncbi:MAG: hypothetical protein ACE5KT_10850 [Methanosarcinales archaeon]
MSKINCKYIKRILYLRDYNWKTNLAKPELAIIECLKQEPILFYTKEIAVSALVQE